MAISYTNLNRRIVMRRNAAFAAVAIAASLGLSLGGCSLFGSDDDETAAVEAAAAEAAMEPVASVRSIEVGTTRDGYVITAYGYAPGLGYGAPRLEPRRDAKPGPDGYLDYDFVAKAPDPALNLGTGDLAARAIRADVLLKATELQGVAGVRIHGAAGGMMMTF
jgi:hypothetical protein